MNNNVFPTKSNLMQIKRSLDLAKIGYDLLDKKRNIMLREMMAIMEDIRDIQGAIDVTFAEAYKALQDANFTIGQTEVLNVTNQQIITDDIALQFKSVMGVEIPVVRCNTAHPQLIYGLCQSNSHLDEAYIRFLQVKDLTARLAAIENSVYRLAFAIKQTQKRANALKNIVIPRLEDNVKFITVYLEEKEREAFTFQKVIKAAK